VELAHRMSDAMKRGKPGMAKSQGSRLAVSLAGNSGIVRRRVATSLDAARACHVDLRISGAQNCTWPRLARTKAGLTPDLDHSAGGARSCGGAACGGRPLARTSGSALAMADWTSATAALTRSAGRADGAVSDRSALGTEISGWS